MKYLILDAEMGGRDIRYSLLTVYFLVVDANFQKIGDLYLAVRPDDGDYIVSGQGMSVNRINLIEHNKIAISYKQAKPVLFDFLKQHSGNERLTPVGHGVVGDIRHIKNNLISEGSWEQFCTYHYIDTSMVLQFLRVCGKMAEDCDGSVTALAEYFNIQVEGADHDCKVDTLKTLGIYKEFVRIGSLSNFTK